MPNTVSRKGRVGILATVILLMSIVAFVGSIYWLAINGPWNGGGSLFGKDLFKPASIPSEKTEVKTDTVQEVKENITGAISELKQLDCVFTDYSGDYSSLNPVQLNYSDFKELAVSHKIVFTVDSTQDNVVLLVIKNDVASVWDPQQTT